MNYSEMPSVMLELESMNLKPTVKDRYGKAIVFIEKDDHLTEKVQKAIALMTKQKKLKIIDFAQHIGIF